MLIRAGRLRDEVTVIGQRARVIRAQAGDVRLEAAGAGEPPHRLRGVLACRAGKSVTDARVAAPPADVAGDVPALAENLVRRGGEAVGFGRRISWLLSESLVRCGMMTGCAASICLVGAGNSVTGGDLVFSPA
jgi:hypothetical protein